MTLTFWPSRSNSRSKDGERAVDQTYRLNCVFSTSKSAQTTWASVAVLSMTLTFDLQGQIPLTFKVKFKVKGRGTRCRPNLTGRIACFRRQNQCKPRGQVSQYFRWPWPLTFKVKFKVKGRGTRCRPNLQAELRVFDIKISANHVGKCRSTFDDLDLWPSRSKFKVKGRGTRCRPNLQAELRAFDVKISANHVGKCRSTFDDLDFWPSRSNSRSKDGERAVDQTNWPNCVFSTSKSAQTTWASVAVLSMTLTFDLQGQIQGQRTGNAL